MDHISLHLPLSGRGKFVQCLDHADGDADADAGAANAIDGVFLETFPP